MNQEEQISELKQALEDNPNGLALMDARKITKLSYPFIKQTVKEWGYRIEKKPVKRVRTMLVIVKRGDNFGE